MNRPPWWMAAGAGLVILSVLIFGIRTIFGSQEATTSAAGDAVVDDHDHDAAIPPGLKPADHEAANKVATDLVLAYLRQSSAESRAERASRLRPLVTAGSPIPEGPGALTRRDVPEGASYSSSGTLSFVNPIGGSRDRLEYLVAAEMQLAVVAGDRKATPSKTVTYRVGVGREGSTWKVASLKADQDTSDAIPIPVDPPDAKAPDVPSEKRDATVSPAMTKVAQQYLAERENQMAFQHESAKDWVQQVKPIMTAAGWKALDARTSDRGGAPWELAQGRKLSVRVTEPTCFSHPSGGPRTSTRVTVFCDAADTTVNTAGQPVPKGSLPNYWPYNGPVNIVLELHRQNGTWLVHEDRTGEF